MTKKIFAMFLAVLMVVSMLPTSVFAAGCPLKGTNNHTVKNCEWDVVGTTAPTCGNPGYTSYKCKACGDFFIDNMVEPTGEHVYEEVAAEAPTCEKPGKTAGYKCACGDEYGREIIPALYTDRKCEWSDWAPAAVNCLTGGTKTRHCLHCGAEDEPWKIEKKDAHSFGAPVLVTPATATENGLAVSICADCGEKKNITVFFDHTCDLLLIPAVANTCFTDGKAAHYVCRVCDAIYLTATSTTAATAAQIAALVIPASHTWKDGVAPTCVKPTAYCTVCKANITETVAHTMDWTVVAEPNCTAAGFKTGKCSETGCYYQAYEAIPALNHVSVTQTVAATCGTFAYAYTYCVRKDCTAELVNSYTDKNGIYYKTTASFVPMNSVLTGMPLYFGSVDQLGNMIYLDGALWEDTTYRLNVTKDPSKAAQFYVEAVEGVEGGYHIYMLGENDAKTYVTVTTSTQTWGTQYSLALVNEAPAAYFTWNKDYNTLTMVFATTEIFIALRDKKAGTEEAGQVSYVYAIEKKNLENQNKAQYSVFQFSPSIAVDKDGKVNLVNVVVDYAGGFNANNHVLEHVITPATCVATGIDYKYCSNHSCTYSETVVLDKVDHSWRDATLDEATLAGKVVPTVDGVPALKVAPTCTVAGYAFEKCDTCGVVEMNAKAALGHEYDDEKDPVKFEGDHTTDTVWAWTCDVCQGRVVAKRERWEGLNKTWDTEAAAQDAHDDKLVKVGLYAAGNCTTVGLVKYVCTDPACDSRVIYVKQYTEIKDEDGNVVASYITGKHAMPEGTAYKPATCTEDGYIATYQCAVCKAIIGNAALGQPNKLPMTGHSYVANPNYEAPKHNAPVFKTDANWVAKEICSVCGDQKHDGTTELGRVNVAIHCTSYTYVYYLCHCGEEHAYNFVGALNHVMRPMTSETYTYTVELEDGTTKEVTEPTFVAPTCYSAGYRWEVCAQCNVVNKVALDPVAHENKAGEKFTDKCTDTVTDRHCVVCHEVEGHTTLGNAHDCYTHDWDESETGFVACDCLIGKTCHYVINTMVPSTCTTNAHSLKVCGDCGKETVQFANLGWNGHRPTEADYVMVDGEKQYIKYANYQYVEYTWISVAVVDGEFKAVPVKYLAKMLEYTAPTYTSEGSFKAYCEECKMEVTQTLAKKAGLGIELNVSNANGADEFGYGSLVEVVVTANGLNEGVYGFDFDLNYTNGLVFVGYETMNDNFIFTVSNPAKVTGNKIDFIGRAVNDINGKMQNIEITADTALVKLFFRVKTENKSEQGFTFTDAKATELKNNVPVSVGCTFEAEAFNVRAMLDFDKNGEFSVNDLYLAMSLLTGEHPAGKTYDVTMDLNKDGEVTLEELSIAYNWHVGNYTNDDLLVMGMSDAEIQLVLGSDELHCAQCGKVIAGHETYCPHCGRNPK